MNLVELTEFIVKSLVHEKEDVSVKEFESDDENTVLIEVMINENDMGRVIGKKGKIAQSIRTVMKAVAAKENKKVVVEFID